MHTNYSKKDADPGTIYVHLNHPCYDVDVWYTNTEAERQAAKGQGYKSLAELRGVDVSQDRPYWEQWRAASEATRIGAYAKGYSDGFDAAKSARAQTDTESKP